jgi:hypothetical protein
MELLQLDTEALTISSTTFHGPVLIRDCPPDPEEIVLLSTRDIGVHGSACGRPARCLSFERAPTPLSLPPSMKGYELYGWRAAEEEVWIYTLVTGTNRLKTYAEVSTPESVITEHDRVKITVRGTEALKSALDLLPEGEAVIWRGIEWLEGAPAAGEPFPDRETVREIERHCQRRELHIHVTN